MIIDLLSPLLTNLTFFATGLGILIIGGSALLSILFWDWRFTLLSLFVVQTGVAVLVTAVHNLDTQWGAMQIMVIALSTAILALSAIQVHGALRQQRPGSFLIRLSAIVLVLMGWQFIEFDLVLPLLTAQETDLFFWLVLCSFIMLGLSDSPLYTCVALLFWLIPVQAFIQVILPMQRLFVLIGIGELVLALACSYLLLTYRLPQAIQRPVLTDITFPESVTSTRSPTLSPARQLGLRPQLPPEPASPPRLSDRSSSDPTRRSDPPTTPPQTGERPIANGRPL